MVTKRLIPALLLVVMAAASAATFAQSQLQSNEVNRSAFPYTPVGSPNIE